MYEYSQAAIDSAPLPDVGIQINQTEIGPLCKAQPSLAQPRHDRCDGDRVHWRLDDPEVAIGG